MIWPQYMYKPHEAYMHVPLEIQLISGLTDLVVTRDVKLQSILWQNLAASEPL